MRIDFDAGNMAELAAVAALISSLSGESPVQEMVAYAYPDSQEVASAADAFQSADSGLPPVAAVPLPPAISASPAVPSAPPVSTAPVAPSAGQVDADGLPWDNRIHSTPPSLKKDGKWRGKRGLDDATRVAVTAELKQAMAAPAAPADNALPPMFEESAPGIPLPPAMVPPADANTVFGAENAALASSPPPAPPAPPAPVAPPAPPAPVAPPAPPAGGPATDFPSLMRKVTALQTAGKLTVADTGQIAQSLGLTGLRDLMVRPDLIPSFDQLLPTGA